MVRVSRFVAGGRDAHAAGRSRDAFRFAQFITKLLVDRLLDATVFIRPQQLDGEGFGSLDHVGSARSEVRTRIWSEWEGRGEVDPADARTELLMGVLVEAKAETSHVDVRGAESREAADSGEPVLLGGEAHVAEAEDAADD